MTDPIDNPDLLMETPKRKGRPPNPDKPQRQNITRAAKVDQQAYRGLALPEDAPVFKDSEIAALESLATVATPEEFQKGVAQFFRKLIVRGMENVPVPRTIKEIQALADMLRKAEGLDQKDKGNGIATGLVAPRRMQRKQIVVEAEQGDTELGTAELQVDDFEV